MIVQKNSYNTAFWSILLLGASILFSVSHLSEAQTTTATMTFRSLINEDKKELGDDSLRLRLDLFEDPDFYVPIKLENIQIEGAKIETRDYLNTLILDVTDAKGDVKVVISNQKLGNVALSLAHLVAVDITQCPDLQKAEFTINQLKEIDLSNNKELEYLNLSINKLSKLDLSHNPKLTLVDCGFNEDLEALDLSNNLQLETFYASGNKKLTFLDLSKHNALKTLVCPNCVLTDLRLSPIGKLRDVKIYGNRLDRKAVSALSRDIPTREKEEVGHLVIVNTQDPNEGNVCWREDVNAFKAKNWKVIDINGDGTEPKEYTYNTVIKGSSSVKVYPNPACEVVNVVSTHPWSVVQIYNFFGDIVYEGMTAEDGACVIDLSNLSPGVYLVSVENDVETPLVVR